MIKVSNLALSVMVTAASLQVNAATQVADSRGNGMGNTGVASADYLVAPFYNPALLAVYKENDDFALLLPAISASGRDTDETLSTIDELQDAIKEFEKNSSPTQEQVDRLNGYLDRLEGNQPLTVSASLGFAVALPAKTVSTNLFARGYVEGVARTEIAADNGSSPENVQQRYEDSNVEMLAFGYSEVGLSFAKQFNIAQQTLAFGITPKYQQLVTYVQRVTVSDFDLDDYDQSETSKNAFNFDLGVLWYLDEFRAGLAIKDVLSQEIQAAYDGIEDTYKLDTQVTLGLAYTNDYFTTAIDADLTKQSRFTKLDDDTQFVRFGIEGNAWGWAQLRAGYEFDLQDTVDNSITAGIGISPFDVVSFDLAGAYAGDHQFGASANVAFTF